MKRERVIKKFVITHRPPRSFFACRALQSAPGLLSLLLFRFCLINRTKPFFDKFTILVNLHRLSNYKSFTLPRLLNLLLQLQKFLKLDHRKQKIYPQFLHFMIQPEVNLFLGMPQVHLQDIFWKSYIRKVKSRIYMMR